MPQAVTILKNAQGINNKVTSHRIAFNPETGIAQLSNAVNVDVLRDYAIQRRGGYDVATIYVNGSQVSAFETHSGWAGNGQAYCVGVHSTGDSIYKIEQITDNNVHLKGIRSGLSTRERMSFASHGPFVFYCNGSENGYLDGYGSNSWVGSDDYEGPLGFSTIYDDETTEVTGRFQGRHYVTKTAPLGHLVTSMSGFVVVAKDDNIYWSLPDLPFHWRPSVDRLQFQGKITLLKGMPGGLWVADQYHTYWCQADTTEIGLRFQVIRRAFQSAIPGACAENLFDSSQSPWMLERGIDGLAAVWLAKNGPLRQNAGVCIGTEQGVFRNMTQEVLNLTDGDKGYAFVNDYRFVGGIET